MKTKKFCLTTLILLVSAFCLEAQKISTGIHLGVSNSSVKISSLDNTIKDGLHGKNIMGFEGGVYLKGKAGPVYVKPMALLSYQGGRLDFVRDDGKIESSKFTSGKLEIPVLFGLSLPGPFRIEGGPVYNWIFQTSVEKFGTINVAPSGLGYRVGANVQIAILNLGIAYQGIMNKSGNVSRASFNNPSELILGLGIEF
jgi:hypothetical protein